MDRSNNLIDLSSPENRTNGVNTNQSLIPCPNIAPSILISNPFDSISEQLQVATDDPFEAVLNSALCSKKRELKKKKKRDAERKHHLNATNDQDSNGQNDQVNEISTTHLEVIERPISVALNDISESEQNKENEDPKSSKEMRKTKNVSNSEEGKRSPLSEISMEHISLQEVSFPSLLSEVDESQTLDKPDYLMISSTKLDDQREIKISGDENGMRGKKCQSVPMLYTKGDNGATSTANNSFCGDFDALEGFKPLGDLVNNYSNQSIDESNENRIQNWTCDPLKARVNMKSLSAPSLSTPHRDNKSAETRQKTLFSLTELSPVLSSGLKASSGSSTIEPNSLMNRAMFLSKTRISSEDTSVSFSLKKVNTGMSFNGVGDDDEDVFVEAQKLAQSFSEGMPLNGIDDVADLLATDLQLVHGNSSDEENDSLRNDPSINFNFTSPVRRQKKIIEFSDAVKNYKKRRSSTDPDLSSTGPLDDSTDNFLKKSASFSSSETAKPSKSRTSRTSPTTVTAGLGLLKKQIDALPIANNLPQALKPNKTAAGVCSQKGAPLKATVPVQFMIRSGTNKDLDMDKKTAPIKPITQSKLRITPKMKPQKTVTTPRPVASSTPNKSRSANVSPAHSPILEENRNHRKSFDSSEFGQGNESKRQTKQARSSSLTNIPNSQHSLKNNERVNSTPTRNGLSIRNSIPIMKPGNTGKMNSSSSNNKKLSSLPRNSSYVSPSPTSTLVRKYGKLPSKLLWGQVKSYKDKENVVP